MPTIDFLGPEPATRHEGCPVVVEKITDMRCHGVIEAGVIRVDMSGDEIADVSVRCVVHNVEVHGDIEW